MQQKKISHILSAIFLLGSFFVMLDISYASSTGKLVTKNETWALEVSQKEGISTDADEEKTETGTLDDIKTSSEKSDEEEKLKQDINTYIIESYKAQWSKIVKELSVKLTKSIPDGKDRQEAYKKIQSSLELRVKRTERLKMSETKKMILAEFLEHVIGLLEKKIEELE